MERASRPLILASVLLPLSTLAPAASKLTASLAMTIYKDASGATPSDLASTITALAPSPTKATTATSIVLRPEPHVTLATTCKVADGARRLKDASMLPPPVACSLITALTAPPFLTALLASLPKVAFGAVTANLAVATESTRLASFLIAVTLIAVSSPIVALANAREAADGATTLALVSMPLRLNASWPTLVVVATLVRPAVSTAVLSLVECSL